MLFISNDAEFKLVWQFHHKKEKSELMHLITLEAFLLSLKEVFLKLWGEMSQQGSYWKTIKGWISK